MSAFLCNIWWVTLGGTIAWAGYWLLDKLFRRDGAAAASLAYHDYEHQRLLETDLTVARSQAKDADRLRAELMSYKSEHEAASLSLGQLHTQIESRKTAASSRSEELAKYKADLAAAVAAASAKAMDVDRLRSELDAAKNGSSVHSAEFAKLKIDFAAASANAEEAAKLRTELNSANIKLAELVSLRSELEASKKAGAAQSADSAKLRSDLTAAHARAADAERLRAEAATAKASAKETATKLAGLQSEVELPSIAGMAGFQPRKNGRDDLTIIEGIGPKINDLLIAASIDTFAKLARTDIPNIQAILDKAGPNFKLAQPDSWPRQSRLCAAGNWEDLKILQDELIAGVKPAGKTS